MRAKKYVLSEQEMPRQMTPLLPMHTLGHNFVPAPIHAVAMTIKEALKAKEEAKEKTILFNWSGHGLVDLLAYESYFRGKLTDHKLSPEQTNHALKDIESLPKPKSTTKGKTHG